MFRKSDLRAQVIASAVGLGLFSASLCVPSQAYAQQGCSPYVGGSCGYQDTHPPVRWHRQNPYYNGDVDPRVGYGPGNGSAGGSRGGGAFYRGGGGGVRVQSFSYEVRMCHDWVMRNGIKTYTGPAHAC